MALNDKTLIFLGSSVTHGGGGWSMCEFLHETLGCTVVKWAVPGTTLATARPNSYVERFSAHLDAQPVCDQFICQLSTNDATMHSTIALGAVSASFDPADFHTDTIVGAMEFIIGTAKARWNCRVAFYTGAYFISERYDAEKYQQMVDLLYVLAEKWDIDVIDMWNDAEMRAVTPEVRGKYMNDEIHPNRTGYSEWWGPKFTAYVKARLG